MANWKIYCMEDSHPGLWQRWFVNQCAAVGWGPDWGFRLKGKPSTGSWAARHVSSNRAWSQIRGLIDQIQPGDVIVVSLRGHRVGRVGVVTGKAIGDHNGQWDPL